MGLFDRILGRKTTVTAPVVAYDSAGNPTDISPREYRETLLPDLIRRVWHSPDGLYGTLLLAIGDGLAADCIAPAQHLVDIDAVSERAVLLLGLAWIETDEAPRARAALDTYLQESNESAPLLTLLAQTHLGDQRQRGALDRALRLLWRALKLDSNFAPALHLWASLRDEEGGAASCRAAFTEVTELSGSFRAQLWLARTELENGDLERALALYQQALPNATEDGDALTMITGDLGRHRRPREAVELVQPIYETSRHGPEAGLNLAQAWLELGSPLEAANLLDRLEMADWWDVRTTLSELRAQIQESSQL